MSRFLQLDEIAHMRAFSEMRAHPQTRERPGVRLRIEPRRGNHRERKHLHAISQHRVDAQSTHAPIRQFSPITVSPVICANGPDTVSMPIFTSASTVTVSGFSIVTPSSINWRTLRSRRMRSASASSTRLLMPSSSLGSGNLQRRDTHPARIRIATISVR